MHRCRPDWLNAYADGHISTKDASIIEMHLSTCQACRKELRSIMKMKDLMGQLPIFTAPESIRPRAAQQAAAACDHIKPLLGAYLDKEVSSIEHEALQLHLALCPDCQQELQATARLRHTVASLAEVKSPPQIRERVAAALAQRRKPVAQPAFSLSSLFGGLRRVSVAGALASAILALLVIQPWAERGQAPDFELDSHPGMPMVNSVSPKAEPQTEVALSIPSITTENKKSTSLLNQPQARKATMQAQERRTMTRTRRTVVRWRRPATNMVRFAALTKEPSLDMTEPSIILANTSKSASRVANTTKVIAGINVSSQKQELPSEVKRSRIELVQASEEFEVMQDESILTSLPDANDLQNKAGRTGNTIPGPKAELPALNNIKLS